jgi:hypothetical protein
MSVDANICHVFEATTLKQYATLIPQSIDANDP